MIFFDIYHGKTKLKRITGTRADATKYCDEAAARLKPPDLVRPENNLKSETFQIIMKEQTAAGKTKVLTREIYTTRIITKK